MYITGLSCKIIGLQVYTVQTEGYETVILYMHYQLSVIGNSIILCNADSMLIVDVVLCMYFWPMVIAFVNYACKWYCSLRGRHPKGKEGEGKGKDEHKKCGRITKPPVP